MYPPQNRPLPDFGQRPAPYPHPGFGPPMPPPLPPPPQPRRGMPTWGVVVLSVGGTVLALVIAAVAVAAFLVPGEPTDEEIVAGCQGLVTPTLITPSSAQYDPALWAVTPMPDGTKTVQGTVHASGGYSSETNRYGDLYRGAYACTGLRQLNGSWIAQDVATTWN